MQLVHSTVQVDGAVYYMVQTSEFYYQIEVGKTHIIKWLILFHIYKEIYEKKELQIYEEIYLKGSLTFT